MTLTPELYKEFEDIVGADNITIDPAMIKIYSLQRPAAGADSDKMIRWFPESEAVVMPGSIKEVQAVIKLCNRRGIRCKPTTTTYGNLNMPGKTGAILMDLRRMNRLLEIDAKNMIAVVEPYVSFAQVQAEAMKLGLGCHIIGAGSQTSMLASHTSVVGNNTQCVSQGHSSRNMLGVEWILPTGEILKVGAPGSDAGWFSGDGPGPSLRGIMRGAIGASGALGVFTKCAVHLHPWPGPTKLGVKGVSPYYEAVIPPNFEYHICQFPSWEQYGEAEIKIGQAGIAYALHKTGGPGSHGTCVTGNNNEYYEMKSRGELDLPRASFSLVLAANTPDEFAYQEKVLKTVLEETGGKICPTGEESLWKKRDFLTMIKACFIPRLAFRPTGAFEVDGITGMETIDHCTLALKIDEVHRDKWAVKGGILEDGTINNWGVIFEGGHIGLTECGQQFGTTDQSSIDLTEAMIREGLDISLKTPIAINWSFFGAGIFGPHCFNFQNWMRTIKKTLDPNLILDTAYYIPMEERK
jgi:glycolate oxidase